MKNERGNSVSNDDIRARMPKDQAFALRCVRDCGLIRVRGHAMWPFRLLRAAEYLTETASPNGFYSDFRLTEAGRAIAG
jgi:hypothetical protein